MRHEFLPAVGPYVTENPAGRTWRHPIHWFNPANPSIYYPYALCSYALWDGKDIPFLHDQMTMFGDSGGYTLVTQPNTFLDPTEVIRWQLRNCTRGVMLDVPPYRPGSEIQFRGAASEYWEESLKRSIQNVRRALPYYKEAREKGHRFRWWGVVQGEERAQMEEWNYKIAMEYGFGRIEGEGWALAPKPSTDLLSCTRYMRFAHDKQIKNVHLLQVTAESTVALILALGKISGQFELITYDSASAVRCAINRSAVIPDGMGCSYIKEARKAGIGEECKDCHQEGFTCTCLDTERTVEKYMLTCPCQACQWFREIYPTVTNAEYPHYILVHNHIAMKETFDRIWKEVQIDADRVLRWACGDQYGDVLREWDKSLSRPKSQAKAVSLFDRIAG